VRVRYDRKKDRAYIYLRDFAEGEDSRQYDVAGPDINGILVLDFDRRGRLIGIEARSARSVLPDEMFEDTEPYEALD
jgi:uncharacterized protein YuzE